MSEIPSGPAMPSAVPTTPAAPTPVLQVRGLVKRYGRVTALQGADLDVEAGTIHGLVGTNGAGKTTLLRIVGTVLRADGGTVSVMGVDALGKPSSARLLLGFMPDFFGVYEDLTVYEYLDFFGEAYGLAAPARAFRIPELLSLTHLEGKAASDVQRLSRGMQQRLCLARALIHRPRLLLLDEPAGGLDPRGRAELRDILKGLAADGVAVLISSHILSELADMCTAVTIIEQGSVVASGSVDTIAPAARLRSLSARLAGDPAPWLEFVAARPGVAGAAVSATGTLEIRFAGDLAAQARLVAELVEAGVPLAALEAPRALEEAYFESTQGLVT
ncbi:MAG: ABC transporter ATP-binding protein [Actinobacteria bacterium]|nr:ABC transporter ATP-binding protein [Actinomycetota bacterium]